MVRGSSQITDSATQETSLVGILTHEVRISKCVNKRTCACEFWGEKCGQHAVFAGFVAQTAKGGSMFLRKETVIESSIKSFGHAFIQPYNVLNETVVALTKISYT